MVHAFSRDGRTLALGQDEADNVKIVRDAQVLRRLSLSRRWHVYSRGTSRTSLGAVGGSGATGVDADSSSRWISNSSNFGAAPLFTVHCTFSLPIC